MFAEGIAFVCFYDAQCILSARAKFLVHLLGIYDDLGTVELRMKYL